MPADDPGPRSAPVATGGLGEWFERDYPRLVGLARRVLDRDGRAATSLGAAEDVVVEACSRVARRRRRSSEGPAGDVVGRTLDGCLDLLVGHPGRLVVEPGAPSDGDATGDPAPLGEVAMWELHEALATMRTADRHVGLLVLAAGYSPEEAAALLERSVRDVAARRERVLERLGDARRLGITIPVGTP